MTARSVIDRCSPPFLRRLMARVESSPLGSRLARGAFWSLSGSLIARGLGLLSSILVGRILGKVEFGEFGIIQNTIGMFGVLAGFGMSMTANKHVAEFKKTDPDRAGRILGMSAAVAWITSGAMAAVLYLTAPYVAERMLAAEHLAPLLRISALLLFLSGINGAQGGALGGFEAFKVLAHIGLWTGVLSFPVMLIGAWHFGLTGAVWSLVISQGVNCVLNHLAVRREAAICCIRPALSGAMREAPLFWRFSFPAVLTGLVSNVATWAACVMLVHQHGGYAHMGVYNAVMRVKAVPDLLVGMLLAPMLPVLSEAFGRKDHDVFRKTLLSSSLLATMIIVPVSLFQTSAPDLTLMLYGSDYMGHPAVLQWLMLHSLMSALIYPLGSILISTGSMWLAALLNIIYSVIYLLSAWWLVPRYDAAGFAACMVIAYAMTNAPAVIIVLRRLPDSMRMPRLGSLTLFASAAFCVCMLASLHLDMAPAMLCGSAAAALFCLGTWRLYSGPKPVPAG